LIFLFFMFVFCIYLLIDTMVGRPHLSYEEYFDGHNTIRLIKCMNDHQEVTDVLFGIEGLLLFLGAWFCWSTMDAPGAVNDSKYIAVSMFIIVFVCAVIFPLVFMNISTAPAVLMTVTAAGLTFATVCCVMILFSPTLMLLIAGADVDDEGNILYNNTHEENSGTTPSPTIERLWLSLVTKTRSSIPGLSESEDIRRMRAELSKAYEVIAAKDVVIAEKDRQLLDVVQANEKVVAAKNAEIAALRLQSST